MEGRGITPEMPPCDAIHIASYLFEIGPTVGGDAIPHSEIESWQHNTGVDLSSWESRILRRLSNEYARMAQEAKAIDCPPPFQTEKLEKDINKVVASKFQNMMQNAKVSK